MPTKIGKSKRVVVYFVAFGTHLALTRRAVRALVLAVDYRGRAAAELDRLATAKPRAVAASVRVCLCEDSASAGRTGTAGLGKLIPSNRIRRSLHGFAHLESTDARFYPWKGYYTRSFGDPGDFDRNR